MPNQFLLRNSIVPFTLDDIIEKLESTESNVQFLDFSQILINPQQIVDEELGDYQVSHIRDVDLLRLAQALQKNTSLITVEICGSDSTRSLEWTELGARAIGAALKDHPTLKSLRIDLNTYQITENEIIGFLDILTGTAHIETFSVEVYCSNDAFILALGDALHQNISLKRIRIQGQVSSNQVLSSQAIQRLTAGIGFEKQLTALHLAYLNLGDTGALALTQHCSQLTTLTQISLDQLRISAVGIGALMPLLTTNKDLTELDLSNNPLQLTGIQQLMNALALMPFLKKLTLEDTHLNTDAIDYLVSQWRNSRLAISDLSLNSNRTTNIRSIYQLIEGNTYLKKLDLCFWDINDKEMGLLLPLLADTDRCHLEKFSFSGNQKLSGATYNAILETLNKNCFITLAPPRHHVATREANERNRDNICTLHQQRCLNQMVDLAQGYASSFTSDKVHFSKLPLDTLFLIMTMLYGKEVQGMDVLLCSRLIFNNFITRRHLINENQYAPANSGTAAYGKKSDLEQWWSTSIPSEDRDHSQQLTLFRHHSNLRIFSQLPEYKMPVEEAKPSSPQRSCSVM